MPTPNHPRMFCTREDFAGIRSRATTGFIARIAAEIRKRAEDHLQQFRELPDDVSRTSLIKGAGEPALNLKAALHDLAFAWVLDEDARCVDAVTMLLNRVADPAAKPMGGRNQFGFPYDSPEPVSNACISGFLPLAWDLMYDALPAGTRDQTEAYLRAWIVEPYRDTFLAHRRKYAIGLGVNPFWHDCVTYAWALAAVFDASRDEDVNAMKQLADITRKALHMGVDEAGFIGEGHNYGHLDMYRWITIAELIDRAGVENLFKSEPMLLRCAQQWVYLNLPGRSMSINPGDTPRTYGTSPCVPVLLAAHRTGDPAMHWVWRELGGRGELVKDQQGNASETVGQAPKDWSSNLGLALLWDRDDVEAAPPDVAGWPRVREPGVFGVCTFRDGWKHDDLVFNLHAAGRSPATYIHQQLDAGHFNLYALGEGFSIDTGYGDKQGRHHSVMMPMGQEPPDTPVGGFGQVWTGGHVEQFAVSGHADFACVNIAHAWQCHANLRRGLVVRLPGGSPYVVLLDEVNYKADWLYYDWIMQTEPGNTIETENTKLAGDDGGGATNKAETGAAVEAHQHAAISRATVTGHRFGHRLELASAVAGRGDYPSPHRIEWRQDVIDSTPFHGPDRTLTLGIGPRPRLVGRLWGYNGNLLTAMIPRRKDQAPASIHSLAAPCQYGLEIDHGDVIDTVLTNWADRHLDLAGMQGEAAIAVVRRNRAGRVTAWAGAEMYDLAADGAKLHHAKGKRQVVASGVVH